MAIKEPHELNWKDTSIDGGCLPSSINWDALLEYATTLRQAQHNESRLTCTLLPRYNMGGLHIIRLLEFNDGTRWVARIQLHSASEDSAKRLLHEIHTMSAIRQQQSVPVPMVFGYESSTDNPVGAAFILMEFIPGDTAMDSFGGWDTHRGRIPSEYKPHFHRQVAHMQVSSISVYTLFYYKL